MKSPKELSRRLRRQWEQAATREQRLLGGGETWPVVLPIGKPKPIALQSDLDSVKRHVDAWRSIKIGHVQWQEVRYRVTSTPVNVPVAWHLQKPSDWLAASGDASMRNEFEALEKLVSETDEAFHQLWVRRRSLWRDKPLEEIIQAARLAMELTPGCAEGRPLRALSLGGIDTKFFERHASLVTRLLDVRFDDEVSSLGLEAFLDAYFEGDHWLLVVDLDGTLLPFQKQRVSSTELATADLPSYRVLIVENESCLHQLPKLTGAIAILGAGFDLGWTANPILRTKQIGYWGDLDTWGLQFLGQARQNLPHIDALLMDAETFTTFSTAAVPEPVTAGCSIPPGLNEKEQHLYQRLLNEAHGRLEQEFLPASAVHATLIRWSIA
jgi:hypothetical protein